MSKFEVVFWEANQLLGSNLLKRQREEHSGILPALDGWE